VAGKDDVVALAEMRREEVTVKRFGLPFEIVTVTGAGAAFVSTTVQVVAELGANVDGVHWNIEIAGGAVSVMHAFADEPLRETVTVAL